MRGTEVDYTTAPLKKTIFFLAIPIVLEMIMTQTFNGTGDTCTPTWINFFCFWLFLIALAYILAVPMELEAEGVYIAIAAAESMMAAVAIIAFRRGEWKLRQV